ncbi:MAG: AAA family ATPase [Acidimicrobiales bacterium]
MKIVITGKGGVGKTTVSGTLARLLARSGHTVVAVDCDPSPNLGAALGLHPDVVEGLPAVLNGLVEAGFTHNDPRPDPEDLLARFGADAPDGIRLVVAARIERLPDTCMCCGSHRTTRELFSELADQDRIVLADLEAGLNDFLWARPSPGDAVVVVADSSAKAVEIARRAVLIAGTIGIERVIGVANRCADPEQAEHLASVIGVSVLVVPDDRIVAEAGYSGLAPLDVDATSPAVRAIQTLAGWLTQPSSMPPLGGLVGG